MPITKRLTWALLCITLSLSLTSRADFDQGYAAYKKGDYKAAFAKFKPLAEQGNASAQTILGLIYYDGKGVPQDYQKAVYWYQKAAKQGITVAQANLGTMYALGEVGGGRL